MAECFDCGMEYGGEDWIDTVLPNEQWKMIFPEHDGLLCSNCIIKRASKLDNIIIAKMTLVFAKDYKQQEVVILSGIEMHEAMGSKDYNALCERTSNNKTAMINLNAESDQINNDIEVTLIHELLHIVLNEYQVVVDLAVEDEYARKIIDLKMEQTVESLAKSFVSLIKEDAVNERKESN